MGKLPAQLAVRKKEVGAGLEMLRKRGEVHLSIE